MEQTQRTFQGPLSKLNSITTHSLPRICWPTQIRWNQSSHNRRKPTEQAQIQPHQNTQRSSEPENFKLNKQNSLGSSGLPLETAGRRPGIPQHPPWAALCSPVPAAQLLEARHTALLRRCLSLKGRVGGWCSHTLPWDLSPTRGITWTLLKSCILGLRQQMVKRICLTRFLNYL